MDKPMFKQLKKTLVDVGILKHVYEEPDPNDDQRIQGFRQFVESVEHAVCGLDSVEQELINLRYFNNDATDKTDADVIKAMGISAGSYNKIRLRAFEKLAELLQLEVGQINDT
ncbi:hypothetical protein [Paenibacillus anseongense]|uniref:hypothetical protein n=1 Tax=Paenibacillus anseongense TaxID=2682845 RepID=UPI002DB69861|nr:hypothetical protein [Paenibacillus anseongense]MEC0266702.1 hypothetical protein [Paenibacillus anseongense]